MIEMKSLVDEFLGDEEVQGYSWRQPLEVTKEEVKTPSNHVFCFVATIAFFEISCYLFVLIMIFFHCSNKPHFLKKIGMRKFNSGLKKPTGKTLANRTLMGKRSAFLKLRFENRQPSGLCLKTVAFRISD